MISKILDVKGILPLSKTQQQNIKGSSNLNACYSDSDCGSREICCTGMGVCINPQTVWEMPNC